MEHLRTVYQREWLPNFQRNQGVVEMTHVNRLLLCEEVRAVLFEALGLGDAPYPFLQEGMLSGLLSFCDDRPLPSVRIVELL